MPDVPTHFVYAKIWESIQPLDRGDRYEDPLAEVLEERGLGEVTGGGSQLVNGNEIEFAGLDIELVNLQEALEVTRGVLEACGAPRGSALEFERDGEDVSIPFGVTEGVALYLDGVTLPADVYSTCDINVLAERLEEALGSDAGEIRGSWMGPTETSIYMYGPDAETLFRCIGPVISSYPLCQNARVVVRHGNPELNPRVIRLPISTQSRGV